MIIRIAEEDQTCHIKVTQQVRPGEVVEVASIPGPRFQASMIRTVAAMVEEIHSHLSAHQLPAIHSQIHPTTTFSRGGIGSLCLMVEEN